MSAKRVIYIALLVLVAACIITVRIETTTAPEASTLTRLSRAGLYAVLVLIPALISERLLRKIRAIAPDQRTANYLHTDVRVREATRQRARQAYQEIITAQEDWQHEADRRRALYQEVYEQEKARRA